MIVGGGPTGVELAGSLADVARHLRLKGDFRSIDPRSARILLVEGQGKVLGSFPDPLPERARTAGPAGRRGRPGFASRRCAHRWRHAERSGPTAHHPQLHDDLDGRHQSLAAGCSRSRTTGSSLDNIGRVAVEADFSLPGHPEIFVIGDAARYSADGKPLAGLAPVAMQQGYYVAHVIRSRLEHSPPPDAFRYFDKGTLAVIGRNAAVVDIWGLRFSGYFAWLLWVFVHLMYLVQFQSRVLVLI